ncbi:hypothetical protein EGW08_019112 [Elysia chlorotica]|uniref:G-protein coupled receptors family 1 profile domain-containing protein n=1 Tax=Elysia chlorotica TaxID=188477 RepID=A0A433SV30_ELYCH|nr:hypothetical protein EGW08_019112 [Elysia chlorotica]
MNISTSSPTNVTVADVLPVSHSSHMRNQVLGGVGTLTNLVAVIMLWLSTRIRPSLKQALVSMALGDLLIMVVAAVWRPGLPCWPAMYSISSSILITYFSAVLLAFHNYVAVFYPMRCKQILSLGRSLVAVLSCWLGGLLISLACLGVHIPEGSRCYVIAIMPRSGIIAESLICLLCSCFIIATNLRVLLDIRRRSRQRGQAVVCRAANNTASQPVTSAISSCSAVYFNTMTSVIVKPNPNNLVTPISDTVTPSPRLIEWRLKGRSVEKPSSSNGCRHIPSDPPNGKTHNENINTQTCINSKRVYSVPQKVSDLQQEANFIANTNRTVDYKNLQHQRFPQNDLDNVPGRCSRRANFCGTSKDVNGLRDSCATQLEESGNSAQGNTIYSQITREQSFLEQIKCSADVYQIDDDSYLKPNATVQSKSARTIGESKVDRVSSISGDMLSSSTASVFASNGAAVVFTPARDVSTSQIRSSLDCPDQDPSSHGKGIPATSEVYPIGENRSLSHNEVSSAGITTRLAPCAGADHPNGDVPPASLLQTCPNPNSTGAVYIRSTSETNSQRKSWRRRTQYTLVILCSWCCFLSLPYVVYGGYVAIWIDDRTSFISSGLGLLVSSLAGISSITNPILYAWRFVEWGDIRKKCCRKFRRFQVQH